MTANELKLAKALIIANDLLHEKQKSEVAIAASAKYAEEVFDSKTLHTVNSIAVCVGISAVKLNKFLEEQGWIYRVGRDIYPSSAIRGKGLCGFHTVVYAYDIDDNPLTREHLKWTERGKREIIALWNATHGLLI